MSGGKKPFEIIEGGNAPRGPSFTLKDGKDWTLFECPVCRREDEIEWTQFAIMVRGVLTNGEKVDFDQLPRRELVCTRCFKQDRAGLRFRPGVVALWDEEDGWVRLDKF